MAQAYSCCSRHTERHHPSQRLYTEAQACSGGRREGLLIDTGRVASPLNAKRYDWKRDKRRIETWVWQETCPSGHQESADNHICIAGDKEENPNPGKGEEYQNRPSH